MGSQTGNAGICSANALGGWLCSDVVFVCFFTQAESKSICT